MKKTTERTGDGQRRRRTESTELFFGFPFGAESFYSARLNLNRAVFFDRDGTLIQEKDYLARPEQVELYPGVGPALRRLAEASFKLFIVSNQSGVGRGFFTMEDVNRVHARLAELLAADGVRLERIYVATELPGEPSHGRKPFPQFLFDARDEFQIDLGQSYFVGDKLSDLKCGWNAGVKKSILVRTGYGAGLEKTDADGITAAVVVDGVPAAVAWMLSSI